MNQNRFELLKSMLESDPKDNFLLFAIAKELESMGQYEHALAKYIELKNNDPQYIGLYYHLAKLYEKLEIPQKALEIYHEGIEVAKKLKDFHALSELNSAKLNLEMDL